VRGVGEGDFVSVTSLFVKRAHGTPMEPVGALAFDPQGLAAGVRCSPLRQVLITSRSVTGRCGLAPGDLRENIEVDRDDLYDLASGTVIRIGAARIRLTFHCEPCKKILHLVSFDEIEHKRGYLGCFLNSGTIAPGDAVTVTGQTLEAIPYAVKDRIRWFLGKQNAVLGAMDIVHGLGLPSSYARAMPRLVANLGFRWR
jgi:MOSC domain-containing protein YiiM